MIYLLVILTTAVVILSVVALDHYLEVSIRNAVDAAFADVTYDDLLRDGDEALVDFSIRVHADAAEKALAEAEATIKAELARLEH